MPAATVVVTDTTTGVELAPVHADARGRFGVDLPPGQYAIAVASANEFAFVEKVNVPQVDLITRLSNSCSVVRGRVIGSSSTQALVGFSRVSKFTGDRFVVPVSPEGRFIACLPDGRYAVEIEGQLLSATLPLVVPVQQPVEIKAYRRSEIESAPSGLRVPDTGFEAMVRGLQQAPRILGMGEANHGTGDFYRYRGQLSLELARRGDLRLVLLEADAIAMMAIDDYVTGANVDLAKAVAALRFWITDIRELHQFLREVRDYNAANAAPRIHVLGIDAQNIEAPARLLISNAAELAISNDEAALLARIALNDGAEFAKLSPTERAALDALLVRLGTARATDDLSARPARAAVAARSVRHQLNYVGKTATGALRDLAMADLTALIVELGGNARASVWAHNGHIARQADSATKSLGQHLAERFGAEYYPIAFLSYEGDFRAWDAAGKIGVIPHKLGPTPPSNVESAIMTAAGAVDVAWIRFDTMTESMKRWLEVPRYVREMGAAYRPERAQTLRPFPQAFAAVVVIKHATASTPTPTGERRVSR